VARAIEPYKDTRLPERFLRWIETLRFRIQSIPCYTQNAGSPEGVVDGQQGDRYYDETNNTLFIKSTNVGNTGWLEVGGGGGGVVVIGSRTIARRLLFSDSLDSVITFVGGSWDEVNNRALYGGSDSFVGFVESDDFFSNKIQETPTLPSTVLTSGFVQDVLVNHQDSGILARIGNSLARAPADGSSWTNITAPNFSIVNGVVSYKNTIVVKRAQGGGGVDHVWSDDNGATFTLEASGMNSSGFNSDKPHVSPDGNTLILTDAGSEIAVTTSNSFPATWTIYDLAALTGSVGAAETVMMNTNASQILIVTRGQDIVFTLNGGGTWALVDRAVNPFYRGSIVTSGDVSGVYSSTLGGFLVVQSAGYGTACFFEEGSLASPSSFIPLLSRDNIGFLDSRRGFISSPNEAKIAWPGDANRVLMLTPWT